MSRRKSRRSNVSSSSATIEDTHAPQKLPNRALQLPTELVYTILATCIGDYLCDMMLYPSRIERWDATLTFLHVSHTFRSCTIKLLYYLWGDTFIRERTRFVRLCVLTDATSADWDPSVIGNYKPTYSIFRRLSHQARSTPLSFTSRDDKPKLLSARVVRHPISPLARIWSALIRNTAAANAVLLDAENDRIHVDFEDVYVADDLQTIADSYAEIPAGIRSLLLGQVMHRVMTQAAIWTKREWYAAVHSVSQFLVSDIPPPAQKN
jgi:hypothetical protein